MWDWTKFSSQACLFVDVQWMPHCDDLFQQPYSKLYTFMTQATWDNQQQLHDWAYTTAQKLLS